MAQGRHQSRRVAPPHLIDIPRLMPHDAPQHARPSMFCTAPMYAAQSRLLFQICISASFQHSCSPRNEKPLHSSATLCTHTRRSRASNNNRGSSKRNPCGTSLVGNCHSPGVHSTTTQLSIKTLASANTPVLCPCECGLDLPIETMSSAPQGNRCPRASPIGQSLEYSAGDDVFCRLFSPAASFTAL